MCGLGTGELLVIGVVLVIIFSASRMGALGNALGKFVYSFKKASRGEETVEGKVKRLPKSDVSDAEVVEPPKKS